MTKATYDKPAVGSEAEGAPLKTGSQTGTPTVTTVPQHRTEVAARATRRGKDTKGVQTGKESHLPANDVLVYVKYPKMPLKSC